MKQLAEVLVYLHENGIHFYSSMRETESDDIHVYEAVRLGQIHNALLQFRAPYILMQRELTYMYFHDCNE